VICCSRSLDSEVITRRRCCDLLLEMCTPAPVQAGAARARPGRSVVPPQGGEPPRCEHWARVARRARREARARAEHVVHLHVVWRVSWTSPSWATRMTPRRANEGTEFRENASGELSPERKFSQKCGIERTQNRNQQLQCSALFLARGF